MKQEVRNGLSPRGSSPRDDGRPHVATAHAERTHAHALAGLPRRARLALMLHMKWLRHLKRTPRAPDRPRPAAFPGRVDQLQHFPTSGGQTAERMLHAAAHSRVAGAGSVPELFPDHNSQLACCKPCVRQAGGPGSQLAPSSAHRRHCAAHSSLPPSLPEPGPAPLVLQRPRRQPSRLPSQSCTARAVVARSCACAARAAAPCWPVRRCSRRSGCAGGWRRPAGAQGRAGAPWAAGAAASCRAGRQARSRPYPLLAAPMCCGGHRTCMGRQGRRRQRSRSGSRSGCCLQQPICWIIGGDVLLLLGCCLAVPLSRLLLPAAASERAAQECKDIEDEVVRVMARRRPGRPGRLRRRATPRWRSGMEAKPQQMLMWLRLLPAHGCTAQRGPLRGGDAAATHGASHIQ
jgi:hypothetical protein